LRDATKAVLTRKFIAMSTHIRKLERSQINNLMMHLKLLEKEEQDNPKSNRRKQGRNQGRNQRIGDQNKQGKIQQINKTKNWLYEKINKNNNL
jgi:hypothetical protein